MIYTKDCELDLQEFSKWVSEKENPLFSQLSSPQIINLIKLMYARIDIPRSILAALTKNPTIVIDDLFNFFHVWVKEINGSKDDYQVHVDEHTEEGSVLRYTAYS